MRPNYSLAFFRGRSSLASVAPRSLCLGFTADAPTLATECDGGGVLTRHSQPSTCVRAIAKTGRNHAVFERLQRD